jgi:CoA:oxalate CoA-transferase
VNSAAGNRRKPAGQLAGIRVLDLTNVLSGPYATYQMAMLGAEVIKVENPREGDLARKLGASSALNQAMMGTSFLAQNAGKKSVTIDLKHPEGKSLFVELLATADVLIENFRPGVM